MRGVDKIDSFNANMSKVGLGGTDSSPMWVRNRFDLINSFSESPNDDENNENPFQNQGKSRRDKSLRLNGQDFIGRYNR